MRRDSGGRRFGTGNPGSDARGHGKSVDTSGDGQLDLDTGASFRVPMRIEEIRALPGPNVYHHKPMMVMTLDLGWLEGIESNELDGFNERLLELLPGLEEHHCSRGRPGGFLERLREGTYFGHVTEHVALELAGLKGAKGTYGRTRRAGRPGVYQVAVRYEWEQGMAYLLEVAVLMVDALARGETFDLSPRLIEAERIIAEQALGPSTRALVEAAAKRGIPWRRLDAESLIQLGWGRQRKMLRAAVTDACSHLAVEIASDKELTKRLLTEASIPVPRGSVVTTAEAAVAAWSHLGCSAVIKPLDGNQGKGVTMGVDSAEAARAAFERAANFSSAVLVEEELLGKDYRVLVVDGQVVAASERRPFEVVGDGHSTIGELIEIVNSDPRRGEGHERQLTRFRLDDATAPQLALQGLSLESVLPSGVAVRLERTANLSKGGTARDVSELVHPQIRLLCERAARVVGLQVCGVDLVVPEISLPLTSGGIIEINASPGLRMHLHPSEGRARPVGEAIIEALFPGGSDGRIPIIAVTGTNGKTTVTRMIAHALRQSGQVVGSTTTDGIYLNGELLAAGDMTGPASARTVLSDPTVEAAVLETARGGILRRGLGFDWADVAVITNITGDHVGQDGIEGIPDLVWIKSLVAERVKPGGTLILNADDERLARLRELPRLRKVEKNWVYFTRLPRNPLVQHHLATGGTAFLLRDGWLVEARWGDERLIAPLADIPSVMGGRAEFQIENCLAAAAACRSLGLTIAAVRFALSSFDSSAHNPGRVNLYRLGQGYVLLDYGHNEEAFRATSTLVRSWDRPATAIVGVPGDRDDDTIMAAGRAAAQGFDRLVIKEDRNLRGRQPGEVAGLLLRGARSVDPQLRARVVLDEAEALARELSGVEKGAVAVVFFDDAKPLIELLERRGALSCEGVEPPPVKRVAGRDQPRRLRRAS